MNKYRIERQKNGFEVWDGVAFENPPLVFPTRREAQECADGLNCPRRERDESVGSIMTGRE